jgi:hypothetical protein
MEVVTKFIRLLKYMRIFGGRRFIYGGGGVKNFLSPRMDLREYEKLPASIDFVETAGVSSCPYKNDL